VARLPISLFPKILDELIVTSSRLERATVAQSNRMTFWSWYRYSARTDGAVVSAPRRVLGSSIGIVLLIAWYLWTSRAQPKVADRILRLARLHPFCLFGVVLAFALMSLRGSAMEYLAYSVHHAQGIHLKWVLFFGIGGAELRRRYEDSFGRDRFLRAPELFAVLSLIGFCQ
jgi:hypothetical protein